MAEIVFRGKHYCGAVLISLNIIITAAHCVFHNEDRLYPNDLEVRLGKKELVTTCHRIQVTEICNNAKLPMQNNWIREHFCVTSNKSVNKCLLFHFLLLQFPFDVLKFYWSVTFTLMIIGLMSEWTHKRVPKKLNHRKLKLDFIGLKSFQSLKRWVYSSFALFFELKCLKGTLGNLLWICRGNFLTFWLVSKRRYFDYFWKIHQKFWKT